MSESANSGYVWFRTNCPLCADVEEAIRVSFELETEGGVEPLFAGTLREARATFGSGKRLDGVLSPGRTWALAVTWELTEPIDGEIDVHDYSSTGSCDI